MLWKKIEYGTKKKEEKKRKIKEKQEIIGKNVK